MKLTINLYLVPKLIISHSIRLHDILLEALQCFSQFNDVFICVQFVHE
jgi:hypothetical protein